MAPSTADMLSPELMNGIMDFQPSGFIPEVQTLPPPPPPPPAGQQGQFRDTIHQQQQPLQQQLPRGSQAEVPSQPFRIDSHQVHHPHQHTVPTDSHHQPQYHQDSQHQHPPQAQYQPFSQQQQQQQQQQHQQLSGDSYRAQPVFAADTSQRPPASDAEYQQARHARHDSFANMTSPSPAGPSSTSPSQAQASPQHGDPNSQSAGDPQFDIFEWYPKYQSCQRYFVDHAQQSGHVQAVAAFVNIALPFQRASNPIPPAPSQTSPTLASPPTPLPHQAPTCVSLIPYLRRLVVTSLDFPGVLHGFFGDDWVAGVGPLHEQERRNYLFAAKSGGWASVKKDYDMSPLETVPFMRPLQGPVIVEIEAAEKSWSEWLAMEDWMVGPRAPENLTAFHGGHQREQVRR